MKLVIMTQPTFFVEEDKILTALFDEGMDNLHLYKPGASPMYSERLLSLLPESMYGKITVHENYYLKNEYGLSGIHLDLEDKEPPADYRGKYSRTCYDVDKLAYMKKKSEYVFLYGVFGKQQYDSIHQALSRPQLEDLASRGLIDKRVYALGGLSLDNVREAKDLGFGGVVVCEALWNKFNIHSELDYKELISHFEKLRKVVS